MYKRQVDAFIVSDIGVLATAKKAAPQVEIHISTQAGIVNEMCIRDRDERLLP